MADDKAEERHERLRNEVIKELVETESHYVENLKTIVELYINPIKRNNILTAEQTAAIFSNVSMIYTINLELLHDLQKVKKSQPSTQNIGEIFLRVVDFLRMYTQYCSNQSHALITLEDLQKTNKQFAAFLEAQRRDTRAERLDLVAFIIKPIQRICKYPLLLQEIIKHTPQDHFDYGNLQTALQKVTEVVADVNENKRRVENMQKIMEIQSSVWDSNGNNIKLVKPGRSFLREGKLTDWTSTKPKEKTYYLLNDLLVLVSQNRKAKSGKEWKLKQFLDLSTTLVRDVQDNESVRNAFEIVSMDTAKIFLVSCPTLSEKTELFVKVKELVSDLLRRDSASNTSGRSPVGSQTKIQNKDSTPEGSQLANTTPVVGAKTREIQALLKQREELLREQKKIKADYIAVTKRDTTLMKKKERVREAIQALDGERQRLVQHEFEKNEREERAARKKRDYIESERRRQAIEEQRRIDSLWDDDKQLESLELQQDPEDISLTKIDEWCDAALSDIYQAYDSISSLSADLRMPPYQIPEIVLIGFRDCGKSALLEALVGHPIAPVGTATKRPLNITMRHDPECAHPKTTIRFVTKKGNLRVKAVPYQQLPDILQKRNDIPRVSPRPIDVIYKYRYCWDLRLIDIPGLPDRTSSKAERREAEAIVRQALQPDRIILCVQEFVDCHKSNFEYQRNVLLDLLQHADPSGRRTIFVISKFNLLLRSFTTARELEQHLSLYDRNAALITVFNETVRLQNLEPPMFRRKVLQAYYRDKSVLRDLGYHKLLGPRLGVHHLRRKLLDLTWGKHKQQVPRIPQLVLSLRDNTSKKLAHITQRLAQYEQLNKEKASRICHLRSVCTNYLHKFLDMMSTSLESRFALDPTILPTADGESRLSDTLLPNKLRWDTEYWDANLNSGGAQLRRLISEFRSFAETMEPDIQPHELNSFRQRIYSSPAERQKRAIELAEQKFRRSTEPLITLLFYRARKIMKHIATIADVSLRVSPTPSIIAEREISSSQLQFSIRELYYHHVRNLINVAQAKCLEEIHVQHLLYVPRVVPGSTEQRGRRSSSVSSIEEAHTTHVSGRLSLRRTKKEDGALFSAANKGFDFLLLLKDYFKQIRDRIIRNLLLKLQEFVVVPLMYNRAHLCGVLQRQLSNFADSAIEEFFDLPSHITHLREERERLTAVLRMCEIQLETFSLSSPSFFRLHLQ